MIGCVRSKLLTPRENSRRIRSSDRIRGNPVGDRILQDQLKQDCFIGYECQEISVILEGILL
jgi:hypothetical protein